ncbi:MAG: LD-carboxypeptidase [Clostridia bacterium]|nr:LD-carboxypeptidase [Clostridia bacterium]
MRKPHPLAPGDRVRVIGISGCLHVEDVEQAAKACCDRIAELGYAVTMDPTCTKRDGYLSGTDRERAEALMRAFADPEVDGIFCMKGGWGVNRMLPYVDFDVLRRHPKPLVGFSDITSLHLAIGRYADLCTFHGPMGTTLANADNEVKASLVHALAGKPDPSFQTEKLAVLRPGRVCAEVVGGNLSLLASACGTPYDMDFSGKILFIEEIGEYVYSIDRYLCQLKNAGKLDRIAGLIFGGFTNCENEYPESGFTLPEILTHYAAMIDGPVVTGLACGHIGHHLTLPLGVRYCLDTDAGTLCPLESWA